MAVAVEPELPQDKAVAALIDKLSSPDQAVRDTADDALYDLPPTALPLLQQDAKRGDLPAEATRDLRKAVEVQAPLQPARERLWEQDRANYIRNGTSALDAYRSVGKRDPKWDQLAEDGITAFCTPEYAVRTTASDKFDRAMAAGCDDPLILYFSAKLLMEQGAPQAFKQMKQAADALHQSKYPAVRKARADIRLLDINRFQKNASFDPALLPYLDSAVKELAEASKDPNVDSQSLYECADNLTLSLMGAGISRKDAFEEIEPPLEQARPTSSVPFVLKGEFYVNYAWDARGDGLAGTVTSDGWAKMRDRLATAEEALNKAWTLDPNDVRSSLAMMNVELGQGQGRARLDMWFNRALQADPDNYQAYYQKMNYLEPKWYGSEADMLAFAKECVKTRRWSSRLPLLVCTARFNLMSYHPDANAYTRQPEVWRDVNPIYQRYLAQLPNDVDARNGYAEWAWRCGHMSVVNEQFKILGDAVDVDEFGGEKSLGDLKKWLATSFDPTTAPSGRSDPGQ
jgi:hypothetical protein